MYNFKTKNLKYNMHNLICIASARVIASIDQFDLVLLQLQRPQNKSLSENRDSAL